MIFAEDASGSGNDVFTVSGSLVVAVMTLAAAWRIFNKAGLPGWGCLVPIYNLYLLCKAARKPGWWLLLLFVPLVNILVFVLLMSGLSKAFGKGVGVTIGLVLLHPLLLMILGFGSARHVAPRRA